MNANIVFLKILSSKVFQIIFWFLTNIMNAVYLMMLCVEAKGSRNINFHELSNGVEECDIQLKFTFTLKYAKNFRYKTYAPLSFSSQMQRFHGVSISYIYMLRPFIHELKPIYGNGTNTDT